MKKIMFNDRYGLTQAVLDGRKIMTRRIIHDDVVKRYSDPWDLIGNCSHYHLDEVVAVAQSYKDSGWNPDVMQSTFVRKPTVFTDLDPIALHFGWVDLPFKYHKGWTNKMFVLADLMPHRIRITNIKVERLQDISEEDCMKEGIYTRATLHSLHVNGYAYTFDNWSDRGIAMGSDTAKGAFASLIDRISGKGTWERNPLVYAYEFVLL